MDVCPVSEYTCEAVSKCSKYFIIAKYYHCNPSIGIFLALNAGFILAISTLILSLSLLISNYLFINLQHITDSVHINPKFLYFIIIPLINSLGDISNYYTGLKANGELVLGQLIGSNFIICGFIIGLISLVKPVSIRNDKSTLMDMGWLLITFVLFNIVLDDGKITLVESSAMAMLYLAHMMYLFKVNKRPDNEMIPLNVDEELEQLERQEIREFVVEPLWLRVSHGVVHYLNRALNLIVPLNCPVGLAYYYYVIMMILIYLKTSDINMVATGCMLVLVVELVRIKYPMRFLMNGLGIVISILLVSNISVLLLFLVKNWGMVLGIGDYLLGFLVFSLMNSINDIVTNLSLSIKYNLLVGVNACLGTPLLLILVGIGYNTLLIGRTVTFDVDENLVITARGLICLMAFLMVMVPLNNWKFDRIVGIVALGFWLCMSIYCVVQ